MEKTFIQKTTNQYWMFMILKQLLDLLNVVLKKR